jgi:hypothetical protein
MRTRSILAATFGAAALLAAVPASAAIADPGPSRPSLSKPQPKPGWTLCATKTGKVRLATKWKPCTRWETAIPVAPVAEKKEEKPSPYYVREDGVTKFCAPVDKVRGARVFECKTISKPKPAPTVTPTATATAKPAT